MRASESRLEPFNWGMHSEGQDDTLLASVIIHINSTKQSYVTNVSSLLPGTKVAQITIKH